MPLICFFVVVNALTRPCVAVARKNREPKPAPVCAECSFAHMQYAVNGRRVISCTFSWWSASGDHQRDVLHRLPESRRACSGCSGWLCARVGRRQGGCKGRIRGALVRSAA